MISWRITKYNPNYRSENDEYQKDEWISCNDIGKLYEGKEFTVDDYINIENAYVYAVTLFMNHFNITTLTIKSLEKYNTILELNKIPLIYTEKMIRLFERLHEGCVLEIDDVEHLCRLVLREHLWCKLEDDNTMFVHFGYDYYMYIGSSLNCESIVKFIESTGLFIEKFNSPYYDI